MIFQVIKSGGQQKQTKESFKTSTPVAHAPPP
jgi:hypothetical protein